MYTIKQSIIEMEFINENKEAMRYHLNNEILFFDTEKSESMVRNIFQGVFISRIYPSLLQIN